MTIARPIVSPLVRPIARSVVGAIGGGWSPAGYANTKQLLLTGSGAYASGTIDGIPVLADKRSGLGDLRQPREGRGYLGDGSNDELRWTTSNTGTQYVSYYNVTDGVWVAPTAISYSATYYTFSLPAKIIRNLKRWSDDTATAEEYQAESPYASVPSNLVSWHHCNEESGTTSYDCQNGNDGALVNTAASVHATSTDIKTNPANQLGFTLSGSVVIPRDESDTANDVTGSSLQYTGKCPSPGQANPPALTLDGSNDLIIASEATDEFNYTESGSLKTFTILAKVNKDTVSGYQSLIEWGTGGGWFIGTLGDKLHVILYGPSAIAYTSTLAITAATDHFIAYVIDPSSGDVTFFVDGQSETINATFTPSPEADFALHIGNRPGGGVAFDGQLQMLKLFDSELTSDNIANERNHTTGTATTETPVGDWDCQQGAGTHIPDRSGNGNHGTLTNADLTAAWANKTNKVRDNSILHGGRHVAYIDGTGMNIQFDTPDTASVSFLINTTDTAFILCSDAASSARYFFRVNGTSYLSNSAGTPVVNVDGNVSTDASDITDGDWHEVTITGLDVSSWGASTQIGGIGGLNFEGMLAGVVFSDGSSDVLEFKLDGNADDSVASNDGTISGVTYPFLSAKDDGTMPITGLSATRSAGNAGNKHTELNFNPYSAAELNGKGVETDYELGEDRATVAPTNTKQRRTADDGDDRFAVYDPAPTGSDLTKIQNYHG